jgi:hypothetical protein
MLVFNDAKKVEDYVKEKSKAYHTEPEQESKPEPEPEKERKIVMATYYVEEMFIVPKHIDLENKDQVKDYGVKRNVLYIELTDGKTIDIEGNGWINNIDYKYPDTIRIEDASDFIDISEYEAEPDTEPKPEPKNIMVVRINANGEKRKKGDVDGIYLMDEETYTVYDAVTREEVGTLVNGRVELATDEWAECEYCKKDLTNTPDGPTIDGLIACQECYDETANKGC